MLLHTTSPNGLVTIPVDWTQLKYALNISQNKQAITILFNLDFPRLTLSRCETTTPSMSREWHLSISGEWKADVLLDVIWDKNKMVPEYMQSGPMSWFWDWSPVCSMCKHLVALSDYSKKMDITFFLWALFGNISSPPIKCSVFLEAVIGLHGPWLCYCNFFFLHNLWNIELQPEVKWGYVHLQLCTVLWLYVD